MKLLLPVLHVVLLPMLPVAICWCRYTCIHAEAAAAKAAATSTTMAAAAAAAATAKAATALAAFVAACLYLTLISLLLWHFN